MSSYKDQWFADYERRLAEYEDQGMDPDAASSKAAEDAYDALHPATAPVYDHPPSPEDEAALEEAEWYEELNRGYARDRL